MSKIKRKAILHKIIESLDPYITTGVPEVCWELAKTLTLEVYCQERYVALLESAHSTYDASVDGDEIVVHSIDWLNREKAKEIFSWFDWDKFDAEEYDNPPQQMIAAMEAILEAQLAEGSRLRASILCGD